MHRAVGVAFPPARAPCPAGRRRTRMHCVCCVFPRPSLVKQRSTRAASVVHCAGHSNWWTAKRPNLAFSAGGACRTAPESGDDGRTLVSTPSIASSCTDYLSWQPVPRRPPLPELQFEQPPDSGVMISRVAESNRAPRSTDSNRRFAHVAPERAHARAPADGALARASLPFAVRSKGRECRHERVLCSGRVIDGSRAHAERTAVEHSGKTKSRRR